MLTLFWKADSPSFGPVAAEGSELCGRRSKKIFWREVLQFYEMLEKYMDEYKK